MMTRKLIFYAFALICIFGTSSSSAQSGMAADSMRFKHSLGAGAGFTTGYGLSYRYMPKRFGVQVNFAPYKNGDTERYSAGLTFLYNLIETRPANLFLYEGNHFYSETSLNYLYDPFGSQMPVPMKSTDSYLNNGVGVGIEFKIAKRIGFNLMAGYAFYRNFQNINFTGETALYFKF